MGNLALVFPDLQPASFRPWVSEAEASAAGVPVDEYAARQATVWREGLERSGIGPERLQALRDAADVTVYTPGSTAGVPLNVIGSLRAPDLSWETDAEALRDEIEGTVTSLLALVGIAADPLASREHVLLSNLVENAWRAGPRPRSRHADRRDPVAAAPQARRLRDRPVLPARRADEARVHPQRARRLADVRRLGRGPGARPPDAPLHPRGQATLRRRLPGAPLGRRAPVRRHARLLEARDVDAGPGGHARPARARVHGRGVRLRAAERLSPAEEADPDDLQAGPRLRARPRRSRPRTPSTWTTRRCRTRAPGSSGASRPRTTRPGCSRGSARRAAARTSRSSTRRSAASASASSSSSPRSRRSRGSSAPAGRCRTSQAR